MSTSTTTAFKILTRDQWSAWAFSGIFSGAGIDVNDGFIHLSTAQQTVETYQKYFHGQEGLVLVVVDLEKVQGEVKWEASPSRNGELFPHVYGSIGMDAVVRHVEDWDGQSTEA